MYDLQCLQQINAPLVVGVLVDEIMLCLVDGWKLNGCTYSWLTMTLSLYVRQRDYLRHPALYMDVLLLSSGYPVRIILTIIIRVLRNAVFVYSAVSCWSVIFKAVAAGITRFWRPLHIIYLIIVAAAGLCTLSHVCATSHPSFQASRDDIERNKQNHTLCNVCFKFLRKTALVEVNV